MRRRNATLPILLVAILLVLTLGTTSAMAEKDQKPVNIAFSGKPAQGQSFFAVSFAGYARFFRLAHQFLFNVLPVAGTSVTEPAPKGTDQPVYFFFSKPADDETQISKIVDDGSPI